MIKNFFKIAWRNLLRNKGFSFINIFGLSVGMAAAILITLWIQNEISYDQFHAKKDRIYEAWNKATFSNSLHCWNTTPKILARTAEKDVPEIERAVRVNWPQGTLFSVGDKRLTPTGSMVDTGFLQMFSFPLIKGNPATALNDMSSIILTEQLAKKIFGDEDAMGKVIKVDNTDNFTVTGIMKDLPANTRFNFEYLVPWSYLVKKGWDDSSWGNNSTRTYIMLKEHASLAAANAKMKTIKVKYDKEDPKWEMFLYPASRWRLYSSFKNGVEEGGLIEFVRLFGIIAIFVLLIACINFMNLSTARSEKRAKEVGIRKVVGAQKSWLVSQFLGESVLLSLLAGIVALIIVQLVLPSFSELTDRKLSVNYGSSGFWLASVGFVLLTGILAGSYPAFFLSSFQPVKVLKGTFKAANALITPRKLLVVLQFTFAIILIICTSIVKQQIDHAQERESGYNRENLVYHMLSGDLEKKYDLVKNDLISSGVAVSVTKTSAPLTEGWSDSWGFDWEGKDPADKTDFDRYGADEHLVKTAGFKLIKGRDFNLKEFPTDSNAMILNESAAKHMNFKDNDPLGKIVKGDGRDWHIIGVIGDFILQSPYHPTRPMVIQGGHSWFNVMHFRLNTANSTADNLKKAQAIFKKYNPEYPFEYKFIDEQYEEKFKGEQRTAALAGIFAGLTILISCLGLFGLATYMAENRIKEIGVRKVLGASVTGITTLLSKDFLKLVMISFLLASPVAWWLMHSWLKDYPYHINIQWTVFAFAALLSFIISVVTVSYQSIKAAIANPVKSLRSE